MKHLFEHIQSSLIIAALAVVMYTVWVSMPAFPDPHAGDNADRKIILMVPPCDHLECQRFAAPIWERP